MDLYRAMDLYRSMVLILRQKFLKNGKIIELVSYFLC